MKNLIGTKEDILKAEEKRNQFISGVQMTSKEDCLEIPKEEGFPEDFNYEHFQLICEIILLHDSATWWLERTVYLDDVIMVAEDLSEESLNGFLKYIN